MMRKSEIIWLTEVDSTNRFALDNFECFESGTLIAASCQYAGRGSKGRSWVSPPDVNIYASLILKDFACPLCLASWIGSLSVLKVLRKHEPGLPFSVKWPNDVLCGHKKIAGILCETKGNGIVIGIGLNINMDGETASAISHNATSLFLETGRKQDDICLFAEELRDEAGVLCSEMRNNGVGKIHEEWREENYLNGRNVSIRLPDNRILHGKVTDFPINGAIRVTDSVRGEDMEICSGDLIGF